MANRAALQGALKMKDWRVIILASLGGALEFYDFVIYGIFAVYIGAAFFPSTDPLSSMLATFAVLAVGYLARPLGGIVLSHFGDRYGRKRVFIFTILTMSLATLAMGLLPTYAQWGAAAPLAMVGLRLIQGFCLGGELPGAITYVTETAPRRFGFATGVIFFFVNSGVVAATLLNLGLQEWMPDKVGEYGWRIAFILGSALGLVSFWLRLSLEETAAYRDLGHVKVKVPIGELFRTSTPNVLVGIGALAASGGFNGMLFGYTTAYLTRVLDYSAVDASKAQNVALVVLSFGLLTVAWLGDRMPRRLLLGFGALIAVVFAFPFFHALQGHSVNLLLLFALAGLTASFFNGACVGVIGDLFPTAIRFSGVALGFNIAFSVGGAMAPLASTYLVSLTGDPTSVAWWIVGAASLTLAASFVLNRFDGRIMREVNERAAAPEHLS
ncbi:MAG: MFS transporter [Hyphomonadaceae bacterium]|nr:MFS transporter [Hyphomonadaceae bacterium]